MREKEKGNQKKENQSEVSVSLVFVNLEGHN